LEDFVIYIYVQYYLEEHKLVHFVEPVAFKIILPVSIALPTKWQQYPTSYIVLFWELSEIMHIETAMNFRLWIAT
jgi:hypothetical protein